MGWRSSLRFLLVFLAVASFALSAQAQGLFLTPVPNAPFSAVVNVERTVVRPDGLVEQLKSVREIARDSIGHIHNESRTMLPLGCCPSTQFFFWQKL